ncbi:MAG: hypothetical protein HY959_09565 [Ignavibacteriae bacterium]|nr:hypothetical protein [Ignavibacteriota bacterium]
MKPLSLVFVIVLLISISLNCSKKEDKQVTSKSEEKISDSTEIKIYEDSAITYSFSKKLEGKVSYEKYHGKNVIVKGKFNYDKKGGYGHWNRCVGEISGITEINLIKNQNTEKYLTIEKLLENPVEYKGKIVTLACTIIMLFEGERLKPLR